MTLKLVIGNKNYSSWSMRPWLALRAANIAFEEIFIPLYTDDPADKTAGDPPKPARPVSSTALPFPDSFASATTGEAAPPPSRKN